MKNESINVVGLGYIGLPTALTLAAHGKNVIGTDYNEKIIEGLNAKKMTFEESGMEVLFDEAVKNNIVFSTNYFKTSIYIVSVPTPYEKEDKKINPSYIIKAVEQVVAVCDDETIIIIESTVSPGTIDKYVRPLTTENITRKKIHIVHAPERIIPGNMIRELVDNARVVGADSVEIGEKIKELYSCFCKGDIVVTDIKTAEMAKIVENTYRDVNIAFANELAKICRYDDMNVYEIIRIANMHPRVNILHPGPGVGGHCISVDPWFLVGDYPGLANIILTARKINDSMPEFVLERISEIMDEKQIKDISRIGLYGLTYKEDVDDIRESPTLQLLEVMKKHLAKGIKVFDPMVKTLIVENQYQDFKKFLNDIDMIVIMVGHSHFRTVENLTKDKIILDTKDFLGNEKNYKL